jgi:proton-dependent oligopeptide transporter, POT family
MVFCLPLVCINIGALIGGIVVPIIAQRDVTLAYSYPVGMMFIGVTLFVLGTSRYVIQNPGGELFTKSIAKSNYEDSNIGLSTVLRISLLIVPFNIAYSQMATTFIVQGSVMKKAFGFLDAPSMNNADAVSVLFFGYVIGSYMYPALSSRGIKIPTTYKFAFGSLLGVLAVAWAIFMEYKIRATYYATGEKVSIMWQSLSYILIGCGEIFAVSAAYEAAFNAAPPDSKVLASAVNLFCVGGLPSILCLVLYQGCEGWFRNAHGGTSIHRLEDYVTASVDKYFIVLFVVSVLGVIINILPVVKTYVENVEDAVQEMVKTPVMKRPSRHRRNASTDDSSDEESPLLRVKRHDAYLKYGSGPVLYKQGSMRAGPTTAGQKRKEKKVTKSLLGRLYRTKSKFPSVVVNADGKPMTAGGLRRQDSL